SMQLPLVTSMYLGDKWEYLFRAHGADTHDALVLRAYGNQERVPGQCHLELPPEHVWVFPS
ncbi:MAG: ABC transporter ATP-binding protein, partial [Pollutimonas bauzanensis]